MITLYYLCCFTNYIPDPHIRYNVGWSLIVLQTGATIMSLTLLIVDFFKSLYKGGKRLFERLKRCKQNGCKYNKFVEVKSSASTSLDYKRFLTKHWTEEKSKL
jgi:hypothetical protein